MKRALIIANFGGPRSLKEVEPFLVALFTDPEVFRTPRIFTPFFKRIAKKRSKSVAEDYEAIGGRSPIFEDTEFVAQKVREKCNLEVFAFHRYLPATHDAFFKKIENCDADQFLVFPMFPQFTYATTGSIASYFQKRLSKHKEAQIRWIKSYPKHPAFVSLFQRMIREYLQEHELDEKDTILLFSAHGLPQSFIDEGDVYQEECLASFNAIKAAFPQALAKISYQSKVGRAVWLTPATDEVCEALPSWREKRQHVLFVPISFTSDHVETLFEIETAYMPIVRKWGMNAHRLPAPNRRDDWIEAIIEIIFNETAVNNLMLVR